MEFCEKEGYNEGYIDAARLFNLYRYNKEFYLLEQRVVRKMEVVDEEIDEYGGQHCEETHHSCDYCNDGDIYSTDTSCPQLMNRKYYLEDAARETRMKILFMMCDILVKISLCSEKLDEESEQAQTLLVLEKAEELLKEDPCLW